MAIDLSMGISWLYFGWSMLGVICHVRFIKVRLVSAISLYMKGIIMGMKHFSKAQSKPIKSLEIEGIKAYLQDTVSSNNEDAPIAGGFFRMEAGNPLEYTYSYDECKIMLEGEMSITEKGGQTVEMKPGDVIYFNSGTTVTFTSKSSGTAFYVGQRKFGVL